MAETVRMASLFVKVGHQPQSVLLIGRHLLYLESSTVIGHLLEVERFVREHRIAAQCTEVVS
jgi:hypothetical protein